MTQRLAVVGEVVGAQRMSPHYVRITFRLPPTVGGAGPTFDQRIRVGIPSPGQPPWLPTSADWYDEWLATRPEIRGHMRTYSVRALDRRPTETLLTIDVVLHGKPGTAPGADWALSARPGNQASLILPARGVAGVDIEFDPGDAETIVLAGDETAAPAIARILEDLPGGARGHAFIEVPEVADQLPIAAPPGCTVRWLAREGRPRGERLVAAVIRNATGGRMHAELADLPDYDEQELVWETPTFSALGESLGEPARGGEFYWMAGECRIVAGLRRRLVGDYGVPRSRIAFMGYWKA